MCQGGNMNINRLLENSVRNELMGENLFCFKRTVNANGLRNWSYEKNGVLHSANIWGEPGLLLSGTLGIGHETDITDVLGIEVYKNGELLHFHSVRNRWTPAYMQTYYRSEPTSEYSRCGLVAIKETKCISADDVFVSELTVMNDDNRPVELEFKIITPLNREGDAYRVNGKTKPRAIKVQYDLCGFFAIACREGEKFKKSVPSASKINIRITAAYHPTAAERARRRADAALSVKEPFAKEEKRFNAWFEKNCPRLKTENTDILKVYYYRWYLVKKNTFTPKKLIPEHFIKRSCMYESSTGEWYGCPVGLPVPMQIEEAKWQKNGKLAGDQLENWIDGNGSYRGYIQYTPYAAWRYYLHHKDKSVIERGYPEFLAYSMKDLDKNDPRSLPVTRGSWPTGAEYQPAFYQHREISWDYRYDNRRKDEVGGEIARLYRLDEITYAIANIAACEKMARLLSKTDDAKSLAKRREAMTEILKKEFFDADRGVFLSRDYETGKLCDESACYDSFAPFMCGVIRDTELEKSVEKLLTDDKFLSEFSVTTVEKSCPMFWGDNAIAGPAFADKSKPDFYGCCWNGPVWPYANTQVLTALGEIALRDRKRRRGFISLFENYTDLHFYLSDRSLPDIVEHYRHSDGVPFSVTHDYFHSTYIDLVLGFWAGIRADGKVPAFKPLTDEEFSVEGVAICGKIYDFCQYREGGKLKRKITEK